MSSSLTYLLVCGWLVGMIVAVGLSSLQHCDMSSNRNMFVVGLSLFTGVALPHWITDNQSTINTGMSVSVCLSVRISVCLCLPVCLFICLYISLSVCLSVCQFVCWHDEM